MSARSSRSTSTPVNLSGTTKTCRATLGLRQRAAPVLADITINGRTRKVIMQANKNGFYYVSIADRTVHFGHPIARINWAKGVDPKQRPADH